MTSKESLFAILNAVGGLMFLAVLVTVCLAMAAAPVAVFIWLVYLMLKFFGRVCVKVSVFSRRFSFRHVHLRREKASQPKKKHHD